MKGVKNSKEFVNHKILIVLVIYLRRIRIIGSINCSRGGHFLTNELLKRVFNDSKFFFVEIKEKLASYFDK